jgi:hypothetical protein
MVVREDNPKLIAGENTLRAGGQFRIRERSLIDGFEASRSEVFIDRS